MKIGIITNHADRTLESDLQTWAIHKTLDAYGTAPYMIHYHPWNGSNADETVEKKGIFRKKSEVTHKIQQPSSFINTHVNLLGNDETIKELMDEHFGMDAYISVLDREYNAYGMENEAYLLRFAEKNAKKIAYGWNLNGEQVKEDFSGFEVLTVQREGANTFGKEVPIVNDPLLWIKRSDIEEIKDKIPKEEPYLFVDVQRSDNDVESFANKSAAKQDLQLKVIGKERNDVTYYLAVASQAERIITDSMIGVLVATLYEKPFVYLETDKEKKRVRNFIKDMKFSYHIQEDWTGEPVEKKFSVHEKKGVLNRRMVALRVQSLKDLEETLGITKNEVMVDCPVPIKRGECYGCYACQEICPEHCIEMVVDKEGFRYPRVDSRKCTNCGKCEAVCIRLKDNNQIKEESYPVIYAGKNKNMDVRMKSTSGGIFPELCKEMIEKENGAVVGVRYDKKMRVISDIADTMEEAEKFYGAKYAKSDMEGIFPQVKRLVTSGKKVLYSGLPCECAGLRSYLGKDYDNLIIQEVVCHSAASPKVFDKYMKHLSTALKSPVVNFVCKDKRDGWGFMDYKVCVQTDDGQERLFIGRRNNYIRAYNNSYLARPSCTNCQFVKDYRAGDITVGDFLSVKEWLGEKDDNKGMSFIMLNNEKGKRFFEKIKDRLDLYEVDMDTAFKRNRIKPIQYRNERTELLNRMDQEEINPLLQSYNDLRK